MLKTTLNKDGMYDPKSSPRKVGILDHTAMIATVKVEAAWGIDYIHLTKASGKWMIINVIWEMGSHSRPTGLVVTAGRAWIYENPEALASGPSREPACLWNPAENGFGSPG
ncbi:MAG: nuclear transport factor 2 family protein [Candidatus Krumholzibacteriia bacterium]